MNKRLLICDLDNTLYDWVAFFVPAFYALVDEVVRMIGCDRETLLDDFRRVHQTHHDSEFPFALLETDTIKTRFPDLNRGQLHQILDKAFHAFNSKRSETLRLYPNVRETLESLTASNVTLIAHTESNVYAAVGRLRQLSIIDHFKRIYCRERTTFAHPRPEAAETWADAIKRYQVKELSHHQRKPNVDVLLEICRDQDCPVEEAAYVGDSLARDILMATEAGVFAIWAKYGVGHNSKDYDQLVRITHWTQQDVEREKALRGRVANLRPDLILERDFGEVMQAFSPNHVAAN